MNDKPAKPTIESDHAQAADSNSRSIHAKHARDFA